MFPDSSAMCAIAEAAIAWLDAFAAFADDVDAAAAYAEALLCIPSLFYVLSHLWAASVAALAALKAI